MVAVEGLSKTFKGAGGRMAVRDVAFEVEDHSFFTLLGPSGCGKTTLLRCIAGLEPPDAGQIRIDDRTVFSANRRINVPTERRPIGMVFQSYAIWPHMTVAENVAFPLRCGIQRLSERQVRERVANMLERVGLGDVGSRWATDLSGGQQQRLALARALAREPKVLLLDEPLSNLDANLRALLREELKRFQRLFGVTTIYVTHDQGEALSLSDRIVVVREGAIEQVGRPVEIYDAPATAFVAGFVGSANLLAGTPCRTGSVAALQCTFGLVACDGGGALADGARICIRPEDVDLAMEAFPEDLPNTYRARILTVEFLGDHHRYSIQLDGAKIFATGSTERPFLEQQDVWVHLPSNRCRFVKAAG